MKKFSKTIGSVIGVVAALAMSASTTQAQNLLVNGDFETSPAGFTANPITLGTVNQGWATFGASGQSDMFSSIYYPQSGTYALIEQNAVGNNWNPAGAYQIVNGSAGSSYTLSTYALADSTMSSPIGPIDVQLQFLDGALANLATVETGWSAFGAPQGVWNQYSVTGTAPAGTVYVSAYLMFMDNGQTSTETYYFDNAVLSVPEPSSLALLSMGLAVPFYFIRRRKS